MSRNLVFVTSAAAEDQFPNDALPEIAFAGRSNVGKSSLINTLAGQKNLAHVGSNPGKTRLINFFRGENYYLVDLPGYGYARVSKEEKAKWAELMESYLNNRRQLRTVVLVVDARHEPTPDDLSLLNFLRTKGLPYAVVANKIDKVPKTRQAGHLKTAAAVMAAATGNAEQILPFSAETGQGKDELWAIIASIKKGLPSRRDPFV